MIWTYSLTLSCQSKRMIVLMNWSTSRLTEMIWKAWYLYSVFNHMLEILCWLPIVTSYDCDVHCKFLKSVYPARLEYIYIYTLPLHNVLILLASFQFSLRLTVLIVVTIDYINLPIKGAGIEWFSRQWPGFNSRTSLGALEFDPGYRASFSGEMWSN